MPSRIGPHSSNGGSSSTPRRRVPNSSAPSFPHHYLDTPNNMEQMEQPTLSSKLNETASIVAFCDQLENRLLTQKSAMAKLEMTLHGEEMLKQRLEIIEAENIKQADTIKDLEHKLACGAPVSMKVEAKEEVDAALGAAFGRLAGRAKNKIQQKKIETAVENAVDEVEDAKGPPKESQMSEAELAAIREAADAAAMPGWSLDAWLGSLALDKLVTASILDVMRKGGSEIDSAIELGFMQQLGKVGSRDTVLALLRETTLTEDLADVMWAAIKTLTKDMDEEAARVQAAQEAQAQIEEEMLAALGDEDMSAEDMEEERLKELREMVEETERQEVETEAKRQEAKQLREEEEVAAQKAAEKKKAKLLESIEHSEILISETRGALDEAVKLQPAVHDDAHAEAIANLQRQLDAAEADAQKAKEEAAQHQESEQRRRDAALARDAEAARKEEEEREKAKAKRPRRWALARMDAKDRRAAKKKPPRKLRKVDAREYNESLKVAGNAFTLAYAPAAMYYQGLTAIVGRCEAEAGEDGKLLSLMYKEHALSVDSDMMFEPPNFLIPTTSRIEYWAVYDPEKGLQELGIDGWPKEQRLGPGHARVLHAPEAFREKWDSMNARLEAMAEPPLQKNGFVALRLYTGPLFYKYNNVLRGVTVAGVKGPLNWLWMKLCHGNRYTNTLHAITAAINKCSRVTKCNLVYRAPGGILPKSFWDDDASGVKGGVELGLMSTSTSKHAAMEYAKRSPVKLLFEIQQGMCARGADVSWLSMYPSEDEVLFAPCCACEVHATRVEGSVVIVELRPAVAAGALQEKSIEQKEEEDRIQAEKRALEAVARKAAINEATRSRGRWMKSMTNLKVTAADAKRATAEHQQAVAVTKAADASDREEKMRIEMEKLEESMTALAKLKQLQEEESALALFKAEAAAEAKQALAMAHKLASYMKQAALKVKMEADLGMKMQSMIDEASAGQAASLGLGESILRTELETTEETLVKEANAKVAAIDEQKKLHEKTKTLQTRTLAAEEKANKLSVQLAENKKMLEKLME